MWPTKGLCRNSTDSNADLMARTEKQGRNDKQTSYGPMRIQEKSLAYSTGWSVFLTFPVALLILCASQCSPCQKVTASLASPWGGKKNKEDVAVCFLVFFSQAREPHNNRAIGEGIAYGRVLHELAIPTLKDTNFKQICQFPRVDDHRRMSVFVTGAAG